MKITIKITSFISLFLLLICDVSAWASAADEWEQSFQGESPSCVVSVSRRTDNNEDTDYVPLRSMERLVITSVLSKVMGRTISTESFNFLLHARLREENEEYVAIKLQYDKVNAANR